MQLLAPVRGRLVIALVLAAAGAAAQVIPFVAIADLAGDLLSNTPVESSQLWDAALLAMSGFGFSALLTFIAGIISHLADNDLQLLLERRIADHLDRVPLGWFSSRNSGQIKKAVTDDITTMHHLVAHAATEFAAAAITPIVAIVYLVTVDWQLTLVVCIPLVVGLGLYGSMMARSGELYRDYDAAMGRVGAAAVEFVQGIAVVKTFGEAGRAHDRFLDEALGYVQRFWAMVRGLLNVSSAAEVMLSPITSLAVTLAGSTIFVTQGWIDAVDVVPFALLGLAITAPIVGLMSGGEALRRASQAAGRIGELLATPTLPAPPSSDRRPSGQRVTVDDVVFSYSADATLALDGVDLTLEPGTVTALVGPSGSGKSTLARLIARFWDPTSGRITLGDVDLRELDAPTIFDSIGVVFQDVQLLRTTIRRNIALARPDATAADVEHAARVARIHDRITALPHGYDSVIGVDAHLSGGEQQRVSIARAVLADTPLLILDEATAFADPENETQIQDALADLVAGRTLLVIAHRLHTVAGADHLIVLDGGKIVEQGRHDELLAARRRYHDLWEADERSRDHAADHDEIEVR